MVTNMLINVNYYHNKNNSFSWLFPLRQTNITLKHWFSSDLFIGLKIQGIFLTFKIIARTYLKFMILLLTDIFTFFYILYKKKVLESRKFSTSGFYRIYTFWKVLNTISLFLRNVCLTVRLSVSFSMSEKFCGAQAKRLTCRVTWNFIFNCILIWADTDFSAYHSRESVIVWNLPFL